jgi:light-regulated signal transduction histidine kinase (bacteriophytochrome)
MKSSRPRGDVQTMLAAIAKTAASLCEANDAVIRLVEGDQVRLVARYGRLETARKLGEASPLTLDLVEHGAIVERRTIHIRDLAKASRTQFRETRARNLPLGVRTMVSTPLLRDGVAIGAITVRRTRVRPFTSKQIVLLKTFADQAAIAIEVSVSDTGVGIAPEDLEAAFEEFRQVEASAAKQEGTGLGLALSRKFIELHGGTIRVTSEVGAGSTFTFRLPNKK